MDETAEALVLLLPDGRQETYAQAAIDAKSKPSSTMPDIKAILSKREFRDLVAFLATLKEPTSSETNSTREPETE